MRTSIAGATFLLVGAGAASVLALGTTGNGGNFKGSIGTVGAGDLSNGVFGGSDTLANLTRTVIALCDDPSAANPNGTALPNPLAVPPVVGVAPGGGLGNLGAVHFITPASYEGGGSSTGENQMRAGLQSISSMSRGLGSGAYCAQNVQYDGDGNPDTDSNLGPAATDVDVAPRAVQSTAAALLVALDGIAIPSNEANVCAVNGVNMNRAITVTNDGLPGGAAPATCPGCVGNQYTMTNSFDTLKLIYGGLHKDGTFNCNSPVRQTLVKQWSNILQADCPAGNTACNANPLALPANRFSALKHAWRRSDFSGTTDTFIALVGFGARVIGGKQGLPGSVARINPFCNTIDANAGTTSFGGSGDNADEDPIRVQCAGDNSANDARAVPDFVCARTGQAAAVFAGTLGLVLPMLQPDNPATSTPDDAYPPSNLAAPPADPTSNHCDPGAYALVAPAPNPTIVAQPTQFYCPGGSPTSPLIFLNRCFQPFRADAGAPGGRNFRCLTAPNSVRAFGAPNRTDVRVYNLPVRLVNGLYAIDLEGKMMSAAYYRIHMFQPAANGVGTCRETNDTKQIGCLTQADPCTIGFGGREALLGVANRALQVNGVSPTDTAIGNLLQPAGTLPLYPLARRLFVNTLVGFNGLRGGEKELAVCHGNRLIADTAALAAGFLPVPAAAPGGGVQCLDYPENLPTAQPPASTQGPGSVALAGCGVGADTGNSCPQWPICGDGVVAPASGTFPGETCDPPQRLGGAAGCADNCGVVAF